MSIAAKQQFIRAIEDRLRSSLTVSAMETLVDQLNIELSRYEMELVDLTVSDSCTEDYLDAFIAAKKLEGRSDKTIAHYEYILGRLFEDVGVSVNEITVFHLRSYLSKRKKSGISDQTLEGERTVFSSFFGWLHKEGLLKINPCANLSTIKCPKIIRLPFSDVELAKLRDACECARDKAIVYFLLATGCRISEACALNRDDIDFEHGRCIVYGKGAKERQVFVDDVASMYLRAYLGERTDTYPALFAGMGTERMATDGVRKMLIRLSERAGVEDVHPHRFRRTLATNLIARGMPIQEVAAILGHDKLDTTMRYVYLDKEDVHNSYRKYA